MSIPAQGAVGAETMTAGQPVIRKTVFEIASRRIKSGAPGLAPATAEAIARIIGLEAAKALASPRADSDERTAGGVDRSIVAALNGINVVEAAEEYEFCPDEGSHTPTEFEKALLIDFAYGLMNTVHEAVRPLVSATPAQPAGVVPDSLREPILQIADRLDAFAWGINQSEPSDIAAQLRTLLASHPAGQSAGSGAVGDLCDRLDRLNAATDPQACAEAMDEARLMILRLTAPDSTRTGDEGTGDEGTEEAVAKAAERVVEQLENAAPGGLFHCEADREEAVEIVTEALWTSPLAARPAAPAAPEAQGAWSFDMEAAPRDGTPINVGRDNGCGWDLLVVWWSGSDAEYPWHTETGGAYPEHRFDCWATLPAPPASSGQEG